MTATPITTTSTAPSAAGPNAKTAKPSTSAKATRAKASRSTHTQTAHEPPAPGAEATTPLTATADTPVPNASAAAATAAASALAARIPASAPLPLPDLDAPAFSPQQPAISYKLAFGDPSRWYCSRDGGLSTEPTASAAIAGAVIDLALQISPAHHRDGDDFRLRLAFLSPDGELAELNLNAVSLNPDGSPYITSPARSLAGALIAISDTEEDMRAFCQGARFSIRKGNGRGVFCETDIAVSGRWLAMSGALATLRIAKEPHLFCQQLTAIKHRFQSAGFLLAGPAVLHTQSHTPTPASADD